MKHFKYKCKKNYLEKIFKEKFKKLDKKSQRNIKTRSILELLCLFLCFVFLLLMIYLSCLLVSLTNNGVIQIILVIVMVTLTLVLPIILNLSLLCLIFKLFPNVKMGDLTLEQIRNITKPLIDYYEVDLNYIVTKCYSSTNHFLINKDVILYISNNKLRIVNNFYRSYVDFGCYEIEYNEFKYYYKKEDNIEKTCLKINDFELELGIRATNFIRKNFININ